MRFNINFWIESAIDPYEVIEEMGKCLSKHNVYYEYKIEENWMEFHRFGSQCREYIHGPFYKIEERPDFLEEDEVKV